MCLSLHPGTPQCPQTRRITQLHTEPHCPLVAGHWPEALSSMGPSASSLSLNRGAENSATEHGGHSNLRALLTCSMHLPVLGPRTPRGDSLCLLSCKRGCGDPKSLVHTEKPFTKMEQCTHTHETRNRTRTESRLLTPLKVPFLPGAQAISLSRLYIQTMCSTARPHRQGL